MWSSDLDKHFPPGFADANMIVIQVDVDRIEVHVRGLTPEPFGAGRTLLGRCPAPGPEQVPGQGLELGWAWGQARGCCGAQDSHSSGQSLCRTSEGRSLERDTT